MMKATGHSTFDEWSNSSPTERAGSLGQREFSRAAWGLV